jgi:hypothetical protein
MSLPFPFSFKRWEGKADGRAESIRSAGKEGRRVVALISEGFSSETDPAAIGSKKEAPPESNSSGAVGLDGCEPYSDPRLSPRACLNRQAGFTAARPAANWIPASSAWKTPTHTPETSGRLCAARRGDEELRQDVDCGLEDWSGCFRRCVAR